MDGCDFVISTGGVSMGEFDCVKVALEHVATVEFGRIKMKPGKPCTFATSATACYFGLPGNPVSCSVTCFLFVLPALKAFQCASPLHPSVSVLVRCSSPIYSTFFSLLD